MKLAVFTFLLISAAAAAQPAPAPPERYRTASWYAANQTYRAHVLAICRNDPGHGMLNADCTNAHAGEVLAAEAMLGPAARDTSPPSSPRYWRLHPDLLESQLAQCAHMRPEYRAAFFCDAARAAR